jgi:hypothetical protein
MAVVRTKMPDRTDGTERFYLDPLLRCIQAFPPGVFGAFNLKNNYFVLTNIYRVC